MDRYYLLLFFAFFFSDTIGIFFFVQFSLPRGQKKLFCTQKRKRIIGKMKCSPPMLVVILKRGGWGCEGMGGILLGIFVFFFVFFAVVVVVFPTITFEEVFYLMPSK